MARKPQDLTAPHVAAAEVLAAGGSHEQAAQAAGVAKATIYNWTRPGHPCAIERDRLVDEARDSARRRIRGMTGKAVDALERVLDNPGSKGSEIVAAAREILSRGGVVEATEHRVTAGPSPDDDVSLAERLSGAQGYIEAAGDGEE